LLAIVLSCCAVKSAAASTVVVNNSVALDKLTQAQLRSIFTMRQIQWPDGSPIYVVVLPDNSPEHQRFSREQLRLFPYQLANIWDRQSFSGTASRPQLAEDQAHMLQLLRTTPGSIGYVEQYQADPAVKEVRIE
jgi:ABC-type phosphate transport system substrate-binding protein